METIRDSIRNNVYNTMPMQAIVSIQILSDNEYDSYK